MIQDIFLHIQAHLSLLEMAQNSSAKIKFFALSGEVDSVSNETDNRERLMAVISQIQSGIETKISSLAPHDLEPDTLDILKTWFSDVAIISESIIEIDKDTLDLLTEQKEETTKEIATIFKNKEMFKGYNLSAKK
jgi:predicted  nucleic acid-binding Zn-ribbon protein